MSSKFFICRRCGNLIGMVHDAVFRLFAVVLKDGGFGSKYR